MNKYKTKSRRLKHGIKKNALYSLFLLIVLVTSCKISGKEEKSSNSDYNSVKSVVQDWNKTHQDYNFTALQKIYTDKVLYYGKEMTNQDIVFAKQSFIKKNNDFTQTILGDLNIENIGEHRMKVSFIKQASFGGKRNEYPSYLELQKFESEWKICTESDDITDKNLAKSQNLKTYGNNKRNAQRNVMDDITIDTPIKFIEETFGSPNQSKNYTDFKKYVWDLDNITIECFSSDFETVNRKIIFSIKNETTDFFDIYLVDGDEPFEMPPLGKLKFNDTWDYTAFEKYAGYRVDVERYVITEGMFGESKTPLIRIIPYARLWQNEHQYLFTISKYYDDINLSRPDKISTFTIEKIDDIVNWEPPQSWNQHTEDNSSSNVTSSTENQNETKNTVSHAQSSKSNNNIDDGNYFESYYKGTFKNLDNAPDDLYPQKNTIYIYENKEVWIHRNTGNSQTEVTKIILSDDRALKQSLTTWLEGKVFEGKEKGQSVLLIFGNNYAMMQVIYNADSTTDKYRLENVLIREIFSQ